MDSESTRGNSQRVASREYAIDSMVEGSAGDQTRANVIPQVLGVVSAKRPKRSKPLSRPSAPSAGSVE